MPVETISDLPLELVEKITCHLDVKDVLESRMVDKRLYSTDQSIVFGRHVAEVILGRDLYSIKKFVDSPSLQLNAALPFVKLVVSCDKLECFNAEAPEAVVLEQLKSVNQLVFDVDTKEGCLQFLAYFRGSVKKNATLNFGVYSFEQDEAIQVQLGKFIENQLYGCEKITLDCCLKDCSRVYLEAMMKTQLKMISIEIGQWMFDPIVKWIVTQGIPSQNSEAVIHIVTLKRFAGASDVLAPVEGLERVDDDEKHLALVSRANELLKGNEVRLAISFDKASFCYRRRINPTTTCIYVLHKFGLQFLAFYMPSQ